MSASLAIRKDVLKNLVKAHFKAMQK
jgi:hypothetical protein